MSSAMKYAYFLPSTIGPLKLQETPGLTVMAFFNTLKYPTIAGLSANDAWPCTHYLGNFRLRLTADCGLNRLLLVFGRVPLFNCVLHIFLIHTLAVVIGILFHQPISWLWSGFILHQVPAGYGHPLASVYLMWLAALLILYFPCKWFAALKRRHRDCWLLSYL